MLYSDTLSHSCSKLGNRDFVSQFVGRIEVSTVILLINDRSKTSSVSCIEQILQYIIKVCQQDIIV